MSGTPPFASMKLDHSEIENFFGGG